MVKIIMTPKEQATALYNKMSAHIPIEASISDSIAVANIKLLKGHYISKHCALTAADEIDKAIDFDWMEAQNLDLAHAYWNEVKKEIEQL